MAKDEIQNEQQDEERESERPATKDAGQSFPFAKHFLECPIPVGELPPQSDWRVHIDAWFTGRRAKVLLSIKAASVYAKVSEKKAFDLLLDVFADAMGY